MYHEISYTVPNIPAAFTRWRIIDTAAMRIFSSLALCSSFCSRNATSLLENAFAATNIYFIESITQKSLYSKKAKMHKSKQ